jgi:hypothetical protein
LREPERAEYEHEYEYEYDPEEAEDEHEQWLKAPLLKSYSYSAFSEAILR